MDLNVPEGLGGLETLQRLLEIDPEIKAVVTSGYCNDPVMANYSDYGFKAALSKPFQLDQLGRVISDLC